MTDISTSQRPGIPKHPRKASKKGASVERDTALIPISVQNALREATRLEGTPSAEYDDLLWLIAQESSGVIGVRNKSSSARGLFQLLRGQYGLNPNGEKSFGNAVEECQGGIRYVIGRYRSASAAETFWQQHHWY
jgi:hypothetical protein